MGGKFQSYERPDVDETRDSAEIGRDENGDASAKAYVAVNLLCTHQGGELVQTGNQWQCQTHYATFTLAGKNLVGPASTALKQLPVKATASRVTIG